MAAEGCCSYLDTRNSSPSRARRCAELRARHLYACLLPLEHHHGRRRGHQRVCSDANVPARQRVVLGCAQCLKAAQRCAGFTWRVSLVLQSRGCAATAAEFARRLAAAPPQASFAAAPGAGMCTTASGSSFWPKAPGIAPRDAISTPCVVHAHAAPAEARAWVQVRFLRGFASSGRGHRDPNQSPLHRVPCLGLHLSPARFLPAHPALSSLRSHPPAALRCLPRCPAGATGGREGAEFSQDTPDAI